MKTPQITCRMKISLILNYFTWTMPRNNAINLKGFGSINQNPSPLSPWKKEMTALSANIQVNLTKQSPGQFSWPFHFASLIFCPFFWNNLLKGMLAVNQPVSLTTFDQFRQQKQFYTAFDVPSPRKVKQWKVFLKQLTLRLFFAGGVSPSSDGCSKRNAAAGTEIQMKIEKGINLLSKQPHNKRYSIIRSKLHSRKKH